jgi:hypothetical protein
MYFRNFTKSCPFNNIILSPNPAKILHNITRFEIFSFNGSQIIYIFKLELSRKLLNVIGGTGIKRAPARILRFLNIRECTFLWLETGFHCG